MAKAGEPKARVVVGIDLGTTFSGFAYALTSQPEDINVVPISMLAPPPWWYSLFLPRILKLSSNKREKRSIWGRIIGKPKPSGGKMLRAAAGAPLKEMILLFLKFLTDLVMETLQSRYGADMSKREVRWVLVVPSMASRSDFARMMLIECAESVGMVTGVFCPEDMSDSASPHPLAIVQEENAAWAYCMHMDDAYLQLRGQGRKVQNDHELVEARLGGGMDDIVVLRHRYKAGDQRTKPELAMAGAELDLRKAVAHRTDCRSVDANFFWHLMNRIPGFSKVVKRQSAGIDTDMRGILERWEEIKRSYDGTPGWSSQRLQIPRDLSCGVHELEMTSADMKSILDPVVAAARDLIRAQVHKAKAPAALLVLGGLSACPYVMMTIRAQLGLFAKEIQVLIQGRGTVDMHVNSQGAVIVGTYPMYILPRGRMYILHRVCRLNPRSLFSSLGCDQRLASGHVYSSI